MACPAPTWRDLPKLDRHVLPGIMFGETCLPGTATAAGCSARDVFYAIAIPWPDFVKQSREAPGGNRYLEVQAVADPRDAAVAAVLRLMAARSKDHFQETFKRATGILMADVLRYPGWTTTYGVLQIEMLPDPSETAAAFAARGGFLLYIDPAMSPFTRGRLQAYGGLTWSTEIKVIELWGSYNPSAAVVSYTIRVAYRGSWDQTVNQAGRAIAPVVAKFCPTLAAPKTQAGVAAASAYPPTRQAASVYALASFICGAAAVAPSCPPGPPPAVDVLMPPMSMGVRLLPGATAPGHRPPSAEAAAAATAGALAPDRVLTPAGSIAWPQPQGGYRFAVPAPGVGVTHREVAAVSALPPPGVRTVDRAEWERATLPWVRRRSSKVGMVAGGAAAVAAAIAATVYGRA